MDPIIRRLLEMSDVDREAVLLELEPLERGEIYKQLLLMETTPERHWYCPRPTCDGYPHAGFHWCEHDINNREAHKPYCKHARTAQRPPESDPENPYLAWFYMGGRGTGKLLALDTPVPTPFGWTTMGDLKIGDVVFDEQGKMCTVTATFDEMPERAYRLTLSDGSEIVAGGEHQWVTWEHRDRKAYLRHGGENCGDALPDDWPNWRPAASRTYSTGRTVQQTATSGPRIRTTDEIVDTLTYGQRGATNHSIPVCAPLQLSEVELPIDPYVLGAWLGDGSKAGGGFTGIDEEIWKRIEHAGFEVTHNPTVAKSHYIKGLVPQLRAANLWMNKHVPAVYLRASTDQRLALLRGLMDTDGGWSKRSVEFTNTNKSLVDAVVELARSLGQKPVVKESRSTLYGRDCGPKWRVTWTPTIQVFRLSRKAVKWRESGPQMFRHLHRMIVSAEPLPPEPMRCITVDSPNSMYLAGEGMIPTHNTRSGAEWVLDLVWNQGFKRIALVGQTPADVRDVMIHGESGIMEASTPCERPLHQPTKRRLVWPNGAMAYTYSSYAPSNLRGPQHDAAWGDEIAAWADAAKGDAEGTTYNNLVLGLRLGENPKVMLTSTPKRVKLVQQLVNRETTAITRGTTYENLDNLARTFKQAVLEIYEGTRIGRQELKGELLQDVEGAMFRQEVIDANRAHWRFSQAAVA